MNNLAPYSSKQKFRMCNVGKFKYNLMDFINRKSDLKEMDTFILFNYFEQDESVQIGVNKSKAYDITSSMGEFYE